MHLREEEKEAGKKGPLGRTLANAAKRILARPEGSRWDKWAMTAAARSIVRGDGAPEEIVVVREIKTVEVEEINSEKKCGVRKEGGDVGCTVPKET